MAPDRKAAITGQVYCHISVRAGDECIRTCSCRHIHAAEQHGRHVKIKCICAIGQVLILYSALTCASTPVALRYLYLQPNPPASPVLAAVQTGFAAVIMCVISGEALPFKLYIPKLFDKLKGQAERACVWCLSDLLSCSESFQLPCISCFLT